MERGNPGDPWEISWGVPWGIPWEIPQGILWGVPLGGTQGLPRGGPRGVSGGDPGVNPGGPPESPPGDPPTPAPQSDHRGPKRTHRMLAPPLYPTPSSPRMSPSAHRIDTADTESSQDPFRIYAEFIPNPFRFHPESIQNPLRINPEVLFGYFAGIIQSRILCISIVCSVHNAVSSPGRCL